MSFILPKKYNWFDCDMQFMENAFREELLDLQEKITAKEKTSVNKEDNIQEQKEIELSEKRIECLKNYIVKITELRTSLKSVTSVANAKELFKEYDNMVTTDFERMVFVGMDRETIKNMSLDEQQKYIMKYLEQDYKGINDNTNE